ncbi:MAG: FtsH protease activity modulator HflK [Pseudomonadota bacterium]
MAWNEPGGDNRDPWGSRGGNGPPDLDEVARKLRDKMGRFFGGAGGGSGKGGGSSISLSLIAVVVLVAWALSGIYIIDPAERGVVLRLGKYSKTTTPGPHWRMRFIEKIEKVNIDRLRTVSHRAKMLTKDQNIIQVDLAVQYQVKSAEDYLFQIRDPDYTLQEATESALREVTGSISMDHFLAGRSETVARTKELIQTILDRYQTGLLLSSVNLQDPQPPEEVQGAFEDAIKAQEDEVRVKNQAQAYARDILPRARGDATRLREEAMAYRDRVIAQAEGDASRFLQTYEEYRKAPDVTRKRMYLDTMETVLANTSKVVLQVQDGNSLMYLPLDKILDRDSGASLPPASDGSSRDAQVKTLPTGPRRSAVRDGGLR